ncbi:MAG: hypothetical protein M1144_00085 [Candidatus Thermoplasmatota archaeon]|nr:hypothetical protein [Candidatus Thermoplasmatota archaeon]MCL5984278.1 hypothetical protein [Candidatus Thermoplasmatota archaeon]
MPRAGFKSVTLKEETYRELEDTYRQEKEILAREGIGSLTAFVTRIVSSYLREREKTRLRHFNIYESVIRIQDSKIGRLVDVDYRNGEMFCSLCHSTECLHTGFAWGIYRQHHTSRQ